MFVTERFHLSDSVKEAFQSIKPNFGYNGFGAAVFYRTYSRKKADGGMESWNDVVIRVVEGTFSIRKDWYLKNHIKWDEEFWAHYAYHFGLSMLKMEWLPPGRGLWSMGTDFVYEEGSMSLYNCSYLSIGEDMGDDIAWFMDCLMLGVGVGFSPVRDDELTVGKSKDSYNYIIPDSREGWCEATKAIIDSYTKGTPYPEFDYSLIRAKGTPIKRFGGECSGPEPLIKLHQNIDQFFFLYQTEDWYDSVILKSDIANAVGCCVVAGNVRRSAEIALLSIDDPVFMNLKDYSIYPHRAAFGWMSNNSVILEEDRDFGKLGIVAERTINQADLGYINKKNFPLARIGKSQEGFRTDSAIGINPCFKVDSKILTLSGIKKFSDIDVGSIIWSETGWTKVIKKWSTGINKVFCYRTTAGLFYGTANHRIVYDGIKVEVRHAPGIDALVGPVTTDKIPLCHQAMIDGLVIGDGEYNTSKKHMYLCVGEDDYDYFGSEIAAYIGNNETRFKYHVSCSINTLPKTFEREIPEKYFYCSDKSKVLGFLKGLFSANGCVSSGRVSLKATSFKIIEQVQLLLSSVGIKSYYTSTKEHLHNHKGTIYLDKKSYNLNITEHIERFRDLIGFIQKYKLEELENTIISRQGKQPRYKNTFDIMEEIYLGEEETFDITVDNHTHTLWSQGLNVSNCGEIPLNNKEVCNVGETYPTNCKDIETWFKAIEYCVLYMSTVSLLPTHQVLTNQIVARNRRIGCGIVDYSGWVKQHGMHKVIPWMREGYKIARRINQWINGESGIPEAIRVTTILPGGTTPKLVGKTSGIGYPNFLYAIRRMRVARGSTIAKVLENAGYPIEQDVVSDHTDVVEFPVTMGPAKPSTEATLWEQSFNLITVQREWADNAVSNTLNFKPKWVLKRVLNKNETLINIRSTHTSVIVSDEERYSTLTVSSVDGHVQFKIDVVGNTIKIYEYDPRHEEDDIESVLSAIAPLTKSVSLLPQTATGVYAQMPEEGITEEEYHRRLANIKPIDWSLLHQPGVVGPVTETDKYCGGDKCTIPLERQ